MDAVSLREYATELDGEAITGIEHLRVEEPRTTEALRAERPRCVDCNKRHIPRRFVYCVDGTWMVEDGPEGCFQNNPSNIFRVYLAVKEGPVTGRDGQKWEQKRVYCKGLGARQPKWKKYWQGGSGDGYEELIAEVYEHCAEACCPSQDELFLFGYSRGAFVVRAVAGLFNDLGTLKRDVEDWNGKLFEAINIYKRRREEGSNTSQLHSDFHFLSKYTTDSPQIKFLGLFDTVKSVGFLDPEGTLSWLNNAVTRPLFQSYHYDIRQTKNTHHVRHALALLENRDSFKPERVKPQQGDRLPAGNASRTCLEAWFLGFHADMGGGSKKDGLSLWPLQWILSEAARYGLFLEFRAPRRLVKGAQDPMKYTMPGSKGPHQIPFKNGATVQMWDLDEKFNRPNLQPAANEPSGLTARLSTSERQISTSDDTAAATIIHPSVFWVDDMTPLGIRFLNPLACANTIRKAIKDVDIRPDSLYWNRDHTRVVDLERSRPRVLICGPSGVGKSTLVNEVLGDEVSHTSSGLDSVQHEIDDELANTTEGKNRNSFVFHDANGFERGLEETLRRVHGFIERCQETTTFKEQLHCIWYCCSSIARMEEADREFIRSTSSCGIPMIVVFTKNDLLEADCLREACRQYCEEHPDRQSFRSSRIPADIRTNVESRRDSILDSRCQERRELVGELSPERCEVCFVSVEDEDSIQELCGKTQVCLKDDILLGIHDKAMIQYLEQALMQASEELAQSVSNMQKRIKADKSVLDQAERKEVLRIDANYVPDEKQWKEVLQRFEEDIERLVPPIYRLNVAATLSVKGSLDVFSELYPTQGGPKWWRDHPQVTQFSEVVATSVGAAGLLVMFLGTSPFAIPAVPLVVIGAPLISAYSLRHYIAPGLYRELAAQAAFAILVYEKLFWLGVREIRSKETLARAVIEVMKQSHEIVRFLEQVDATNVNDFGETLSSLVVAMRINMGIVAE